MSAPARREPAGKASVSDAIRESRRKLDLLSGREARLFLRRLHDAVWPPSDPERSWDADTIQDVADLLSEATERGAQYEDKS